MFNEFNEKLKKIIEEKNQSTNTFTFSLADLELVEINGNRRKCRIISDRTSKKLHEIFSKGKSGYIPPIKFIDFESRSCGLGDFPSNLNFTYGYDWFLLANKKGVQENSELLSDQTLKFKFFLDPSCGMIVFSANYDHSFANQKSQQTTQARNSSLTQIQNTIKEGNIDLDELMKYSGDYRDSYIHNKPTDCLHCPVIEPDNVKEYYKIHINKCL
jgi:hypothetical protein